MSEGRRTGGEGGTQPKGTCEGREGGEGGGWSLAWCLDSVAGACPGSG